MTQNQNAPTIILTPYQTQEMKHCTLTIIALAVLLLGCNQNSSKNTETTPEQPVDTAGKQMKQVDLNEKQIGRVKTIIALFKENNVDKIANSINYPLHREYPIPPIRDKDAFKQRFNEVFDTILINKIAKSKLEQWSDVGWQGVMLDNGLVWLGYSDAVITAVNYQGEVEKKLRETLIIKDKENLHASLKTLVSPTYKIQTKKYHIRIDELANYKYRYASWKIGEKESSKPDIILTDGEKVFEGSGGNHVFTFVNEHYTYKVYRTMVENPSMSEIRLIIMKDGKEILKEDGKLILE